MTGLDHNERVARRAYERWEREGRPEGRDREFWLAAEEDLRTESRQAAHVGAESLDQEWILRSRSRRRARLGRVGGRPPRPATRPATDHFVVVADRAHLRVYHVMSISTGPTQFELAEACDLPLRSGNHFAAFAGGEDDGFHAAARRAARWDDETQTTSVEKLEQQRVAEWADHLNRFFAEHEHASWDFAAGPALHQAVLNRLSLPIRRRLGRTVMKELPHQSPQQLREHFALAVG